MPLLSEKLVPAETQVQGRQQVVWTRGLLLIEMHQHVAWQPQRKSALVTTSGKVHLAGIASSDSFSLDLWRKAAASLAITRNGSLDGHVPPLPSSPDVRWVLAVSQMSVLASKDVPSVSKEKVSKDVACCCHDAQDNNQPSFYLIEGQVKVLDRGV